MDSPVNLPRKARSRRRRIILWVIEGSLLIGIFLLVHAWQTRHIASGPAPDFQGKLLTGETISLQDYRGQVLLLQFWATWCPVCRMEQGSIENLTRQYQVLSVALDDATAGEISRWMDQQRLSYPVVIDPTGRIAGLFGVKGVPTSVFVGADGVISSVSVGYTPEAALRFRLWWAGITVNW